MADFYTDLMFWLILRRTNIDIYADITSIDLKNELWLLENSKQKIINVNSDFFFWATL